MLEWAKSEVQNRALKNIVFTGSFPIEVMPPLFAKAKALLVTLNSSEIFTYTIPSKVQAYMNAGRPIIASINGEAARVIQEAGAGLTCPAEDHQALAARDNSVFQYVRNASGILSVITAKDTFLKIMRCINSVKN